MMIKEKKYAALNIANNLTIHSQHRLCAINALDYIEKG